MSANAFQEDVARSMDAGMNEHLSKPIDMGDRSVSSKVSKHSRTYS